MSENVLTIRIKIGNNEIEISGSPGNISKMLEDLPIIVDKVSTSFSTVAPVSERSTAKQKQAKLPEEGFPTISAQIGISCPEAIKAILSTGWGIKKPRNLGEIMEAMRVNALHFPKGTIKGRLTDLTKKGALRRIKGSKGYSYVVAK